MLTSQQIQEITRRLHRLNFTDVTDLHIRYALNSRYAEGDADRALELLCLQQKAFAGIIEPYNPHVRMAGAENRGNVTCYLDALLFAMFAKLESFECMLQHDLTDERTRKLAALLRLWVNMLRSGRLIHTDLTQHIQEALASCGWQDAALVEQQDTSEAFAFITETLQLPLLTLQVDLFHQGKRDNDDHKVVYERLLNLAVPPDPEGKGIKLEDCLEEYFNTKVDVLRDSLEEKTPRPPTPQLETVHGRLIAEETGEPATPKALPMQVEGRPLQTGFTSMSSSVPSTPLHRPLPRHRATSIIQRVVLDNQGRPTEEADPDSAQVSQNARRTGSTVVKAVTIPAWQFFRLIPWNATSNDEPRSDIEVARHFNKRPVVGICLKRYMMTNQGVPIRQNTFIDIPDSLRLPHFMMVDDVKVEQDPLSAEYKLVLQSVVCHRGDSLHSGHYVSFARVAPKLLTDNRRHDNDPPPDYEEAQWLKFDDLCLEERVSYVDDIKAALREEMPYLLFYQIVPVVDVTATSTDGSVIEPPAYDLPAAGVENEQTPPFEPVDLSDAISRSTSGYFDTTGPSNGPSLRVSMEGEVRPARLSFDEDPYSSTYLLKPGESRRGSLTFSEPFIGTPSVTPDGHSPRLTPADDTGVTRLSRAAARFTKKEKDRDSKSRPTSQGGEGRISLTMSRLGGLMRTSREPLRGDTADDEDGVVVVGMGGDEEVNGGKEKDHRHHHHHHHRLKDRGKSKSRGEKGGDADAERECVVM